MLYMIFYHARLPLSEAGGGCAPRYGSSPRFRHCFAAMLLMLAMLLLRSDAAAAATFAMRLCCCMPPDAADIPYLPC